jgi:hypothetical protein
LLRRRFAVSRIAVVGSPANATSARLVESWARLGLDTRLDVLRTLDGVEPGLLDLLLLERRGVPVLLELNAAADFDDDYVDPGGEVDADVARALGLLPGRCGPPDGDLEGGALETGAARVA